MGDRYTWILIAVIALVTALLRFIPFLLFSKSKKTPAFIEKLGRSLPYAIMAMLVVYCLKDISFNSVNGFIPQIIASLVVTVLFIWKRNTLISILAGTLSYMLLVQLIFV